MNESLELTGSQRKVLRGLAHSLQPLVQIGRQGVTEGLLAELDEALEHHELVKVRFQDHQDEKTEICARIDDDLGCETVGRIGHVAILYRPAKEPADRTIRLPDSGG